MNTKKIEKMPKILVIDDDRAIFLLVENALAGLAQIITAETADAGIERLGQTPIDAVLLDIRLPDRNGMAVLSDIHEFDRRIPVIFMTSEATSETAIEAMQRGAFDYLAKPLKTATLRSLVSRAIEQRELSSVPIAIVADGDRGEESSELFIGRSPAMLDVFKSIGRFSKQHVPILIRGESGTGKELVARALYHYSDRSNGPFVAVNCAALPENLLESELFGHEKGAFTGADSRRIGKFEQCNDGTLLLDEIGDMALIVQSKVLRVLHDQRFERVGGNSELKTNVRIVAATNRPLEKMVAEGDFREDLLYRLNAVTINLPPLRERKSDIPLLIHHFLGQAKREFNKRDLEGASPDAVDRLTSYSWPGNVRQLRAVVRRCVLESILPVIVLDQLPREIRDGETGDGKTGDDGEIGDGEIGDVAIGDGETGDDGESGDGAGGSIAIRRIDPHQPAVGQQAGSNGRSFQTDRSGQELPDLVDRLLRDKATDVYAEGVAYAERYLLLRVLRATHGNQSRAAEILGITRGKLRDRIATYNIQLESGVKIGE